MYEYDCGAFVEISDLSHFLIRDRLDLYLFAAHGWPCLYERRTSNIRDGYRIREDIKEERHREITGLLLRSPSPRNKHSSQENQNKGAWWRRLPLIVI